MNYRRPSNPNSGVRPPYTTSAVRPPAATPSESFPMETLLSVLQRMEAKLDTVVPRTETPLQSRGELDTLYGRQPPWSSGSIATPSITTSIPLPPPSSSSGPSGAPLENSDSGYGLSSRPLDPPPSTAWDRPRPKLTDSRQALSAWDPPQLITIRITYRCRIKKKLPTGSILDESTYLHASLAVNL